MGNGNTRHVHYCAPELLSTDISGKVYVVTGGNSGVGLVAAQQLVRQGGTVIVACRRMQAGEAAVTAIMKAASKQKRGQAPSQAGGSAVAMELDLASLASVRNFAGEFTKTYDRLDVLINNAGIMATPQAKTKDGFELQFGTNHLGHFLLTQLLTPTLKTTAAAHGGARILCLSSCYHDNAQGRIGQIVLDDLHFESRPYDPWASYAQSKLANLLHARELARRLEGTGVGAVSVHPGFVKTNLATHLGLGYWTRLFADPFLRMQGQIEPWEGAQTTLFCALADSSDLKNGEYYAQYGGTMGGGAGGWPSQSSTAGQDMEMAKKLWDAPEALVAA